MTDQIEELIKEVAIQHGIALGRDDPILILQTLNSRLMAENVKTQQLMLDQYKKDLEEIALCWGNNAKEKSERILNASLNSSKNSMGTLLQTIAEASRKELEVFSSQIKQIIYETKAISRFNLVASAITFSAVLITMFGVIFH